MERSLLTSKCTTISGMIVIPLRADHGQTLYLVVHFISSCKSMIYAVTTGLLYKGRVHMDLPLHPPHGCIYTISCLLCTYAGYIQLLFLLTTVTHFQMSGMISVLLRPADITVHLFPALSPL